MATLGEILRWSLRSVSQLYGRLAARTMRRDRVLTGSERKFRAFVEHAPDAIVIVDGHAQIALVNAQAERMFGYPAAELIGRDISDLIPERVRAQHRDHVRGYLRHPLVRPMGGDLELAGLRKDGTEFPAEINLGPLDSDQGTLISAVIRDVTPRKRLEAELRDRAAALERSNTDLEQFANVASHDLSAPLRTVAGFVELLRRRYEGKLDADADEYIQLTLGGVARMQAMLDDLLVYSRISADDTPPEPVDCRTAVDGALALLRQEIDASSAHVEIGELPLVRGSLPRLTQLFQNLIGNGIKFTKEGAPRVEISSTPEDDTHLIVIRDHGIGIPESAGDRMFRMFERLNGQDEFQGTGIGLAICKRIVEQHGGTIRAQPATGGGTVVSVTLPGAR